MPWISGDSADPNVILDNLSDFLTDAAIMGTSIWTIKRKAADELIIQAPGSSGSDQIYVGVKSMNSGGQQYWLLNGFIAYDSLLDFWSQAGAMPLSSNPPAIPMSAGSSMRYWFIANGQRLIVIIRIGTRYEAGYLGFINPYALAKQFPYPLVVGGSLAGTTANKYNWLVDSADHRHFINPGTGDGSYNTALKMRRPDGTWRGFANRSTIDARTPNMNGNTWPFYDDCTALLRNLDTDIPVFPVLLAEQNPTNMLGEFDGCYWVAGQGIAAEDTITFGTDVLMIIPNVARASGDEFWAVKLS